jgi:F-type H+-transporting ATPase subunit c
MELISMAQAAAAHAAPAAGITGSLTMGLGGAGAAIGVGLVGSKAVEAVGRNPGAFGRILTLGIIAMALAEGLGIIAYLGGL